MVVRVDTAANKIEQEVKEVRKGERKRTVQERGRGAHSGGRNRGRTAAAVANYGEQKWRPGGAKRRGKRGKTERGSRALYR